MQSSQFALSPVQYFAGQAVSPMKVLVIDDDHDTTELLKVILAGSFEVIAANSGKQGVDLARKLQPDVIVVDLLMPGMDGLQVCRQVRLFSNVPILVLSAIGKPGIATQALDEGADDYITKPMSSNVLIASLNKLTRRARSGFQTAGNNGGRHRL